LEGTVFGSGNQGFVERSQPIFGGSVREIKHGDPYAELPPRKDGKEVDRLDMWSALVIRAAEQLEANEKEDRGEAA
jgi:hypothetical protein